MLCTPFLTLDLLRPFLRVILRPMLLSWPNLVVQFLSLMVQEHLDQAVKIASNVN